MKEIMEFFDREDKQLEEDIENDDCSEYRTCSIFFDNNTPRLDFMFKSSHNMTEISDDIIEITENVKVDKGFDSFAILIEVPRIAYIKMKYNYDEEERSR